MTYSSTYTYVHVLLISSGKILYSGKIALEFHSKQNVAIVETILLIVDTVQVRI